MTRKQKLNQLESKDFKLVIHRAPMVNFFCVQAPIPAVQTGFAEYPNHFATVMVPGDKLRFNTLDVTMIVNEDMSNYLEIFNWMESFTTPDNGNQYSNDTQGVFAKLAASKVSDISQFVSTNKYNPNIEFLYENAFPIGLGSLDLSVQQDDVMPVTVDVSFAYTKFTVRKIDIDIA